MVALTTIAASAMELRPVTACATGSGAWLL